MKFKGRTAFWVWCVFVLVNAVFIQDIVLAETPPVLKIVSIIVFNLVYIPMICRNYAEIKDGTLYVAFGFFKNSMKISDIREASIVLNPTAAVAAQDRIMVKSDEDEIIFAVKQRELFLDELKLQNPEIQIRKG